MSKIRIACAVLALTISAAALPAPAAATGNVSAPSQAPSRTSGGSDIGPMIAVGLLLLYGFWSSAGPSSSSSGSDGDSAQWRYRQRDGSSSSNSQAPADTSVGCAWGDRSYGTCH